MRDCGVAGIVPKPGHYRVPRETHELIRKFLKKDEISRPAPDRMVWSFDIDEKKCQCAVRYLEVPKIKVYELFCHAHHNVVPEAADPTKMVKEALLSLAQFYRAVPIEYKDPKQETGTSLHFCS